MQGRAFVRQVTVATGYVALGFLGLTLLVGPANLLLRRRTPSRTTWLGTWGCGWPAAASRTQDAQPTPEELIERLELQARLDLELEALPDMQRSCFRLCLLEGLSSKEAAEALGVSDATVRTHVYRARRAMRTAMLSFVEETR